MARQPRFNLVGVSQHVIQRGNNREPCFYAEEDYRVYLDILEAFLQKYHCLLHAYVLMTNHVHLLVTPQREDAVSKVMQMLGAKYVRYINKAYKRTGTLWEGRYKASLVDSENYLLTCMRYIELNPVRAGMVEVPGEYKWSSYHRNAYGRSDMCITTHPVYDSLADSVEEKQSRYRALFSNALSYDQLHEIRSMLNQEMVLGRSRFKERIEKMVNRRIEPGKAGRPKVEEIEGCYYVY